MRIRKRPSASLSQLDPPFQVQPPEDRNRRHGGAAAAAGGEVLHPVGDDLPIHHPRERTNLISLSDPYPDLGTLTSIPVSTRRHLQQVTEVSEEDEEEEEGEEKEKERGVDFIKGCKIAQTSSCYSSRINDSLGAIASSGAVQAGEVQTLMKKTRGGNDCGNGNGGTTSSDAKRMLVEPREREAEDSASSAVPAAAPASNTTSNNNCTSNTITGSNGKRRKIPAAVMEGSRCSRVNGRGWRCCQQTLVGYSLCEHHLGKGRLRSMSSSATTVRGRLGTSKPKWRINTNGIIPSTADSVPPNQVLDKEQKPLATVLVTNGADKVEEEKAMPARKKIGVVKARSISSLLDDSNQGPQSPPS